MVGRIKAIIAKNFGRPVKGTNVLMKPFTCSVLVIRSWTRLSEIPCMIYDVVNTVCWKKFWILPSFRKVHNSYVVRRPPLLSEYWWVVRKRENEKSLFKFHDSQFLLGKLFWLGIYTNNWDLWGELLQLAGAYIRRQTTWRAHRRISL